MSEPARADALEDEEQADTAPRVTYAPEEGWAAIQRMLDEGREPCADVVARPKRNR